MPTLEERVQALEQEIAARKQAEEMLTIAVRALVSKEAFEKLQETIKESQEQNGKLFNVLINQSTLTNERLGDLQGQIIDLDSKLDGKIAGLDSKMTRLDSQVAGLQTEMRQRLTEQDSKITGLQTTQVEQTTLLHQILTRLPEKPDEK
jgi:predicted  nucleic acid-binding Zn-ribbon protein